MLNKKVAKYAFLILISALIFFLNFKPALDPDLGWHLRAGQDLLFTKIIPHFDSYSYTMSDWDREGHDWLVNGTLYFITAKYGLFTLSVAFALITSLSFFLISRLIKTKIEYSLVVVLLASLGSLPITGVRVQMISLFCLALLLFILFRFRSQQNKKGIYPVRGKLFHGWCNYAFNKAVSNGIYFLPLLFFAWANLHGGFSIGLFVLGLFLFFEGVKITSLKLLHVLKFFHLKRNSDIRWLNKIKKLTGFLKKKLISNNQLAKESLSGYSWWKLVYVSLFSFAATFINPYGYRLYSLIITVGRDSYGRARIGEWQPFNFRSPTAWEFTLYLILLIILVLLYLKKLDLTLIGSSLVLSYLAFSSWRNMPIVIIMTVPLWVYIVKNVADPTLLKLLNHQLILLLLLGAAAIIGYQSISATRDVSYDEDLFAKAGKYPRAAVQYIKAHPQDFQGNMYNEYNWGGYLIWQLPEHKVFIDGRMPHLRIGDRHIFKDFNDLQALINPKEIIAKYNIDWFFLYRGRLVSFYLPNEGFREVYQDDLAVILKKE